MSLPKSAIIDCEQIVTVSNDGQLFLTGTQQDQPSIIHRQNDVGASIVFDQEGKIMVVDRHDRVADWMVQRFGSDWLNGIEQINGKGCSVIPGLVDSHCHPVWAGDRVDEFDLKLRGRSYMEIHASGGGIHSTVRQTKQATERQLLDLLLERIRFMSSCGTCTLECKTGYGLDYLSEKKLLTVINKARSLTPVRLVPTLLAAHAIPEGMTADEGVHSVIKIMEKLAQEDRHLLIEFIDVFCEKGVYDCSQTEKILQSALRIFPNCHLAFHGDELTDQNSGCLAAKLGARSVSHLEYLNEAGIEAMAASNTAAIINPTTCHLLKLPKPPVRKLIEAGAPVVVATDFNPNAMCYSLSMAMYLAAVELNMTLNECLVATTLNAAYALNRSNEIGSLEPGKKGDCLVLKHSDWRHFIAQIGRHSDLIKYMLIDGTKV